MVAMTTARPMTAPLLITPVDNDDDVLASVLTTLEGVRHLPADDARDKPAWYYLTRVVHTPARAQG
eukprot:9410581-Pyramimonas_sp.AAC.1